MCFYLLICISNHIRTAKSQGSRGVCLQEKVCLCTYSFSAVIRRLARFTECPGTGRAEDEYTSLLEKAKLWHTGELFFTQARS